MIILGYALCAVLSALALVSSVSAATKIGLRPGAELALGPAFSWFAIIVAPSTFSESWASLADNARSGECRHIGARLLRLRSRQRRPSSSSPPERQRERVPRPHSEKVDGRHVMAKPENAGPEGQLSAGPQPDLGRCANARDECQRTQHGAQRGTRG